MKKYGVALLAGGSGSRMGNIDKAALFTDSIRAELEATGMCCFYSVADASGSTSPGQVVDVVKSIGPIGGIYSCLLTARAMGLKGVFFVPCDAPFFRAEEMLLLREQLEEDTRAAVWRTADGRMQTTFGYYSIELIDELERLIRSGSYRLRELLKGEGIKVLDADAGGASEEWFVNINTLEEYYAL